MLSCGSKLLWSTCIFLKIPSFLQMAWLDVTCEVLAALGDVTHSVCGCFINEFWSQRESTERWSNPESVHPCDDAGSCLLGCRLFKGLSVLGTACSSGQAVKEWGEVQQPAFKNLKPSPGARCSGYCRASALPLGEQSTDLLPHPQGREGVLLRTRVGGQGWGTSGRGSAESFSFQVCCHHGVEDRNSLAVAMKILSKGRGLEGLYQRKGCIPWKLPWVTTEWAECWICLVKLLMCISAARWCDFPAMVTSWVWNHHSHCLGKCDLFGCQVFLLEEVVSFYGRRTSLTSFALLLEAQEMMLPLQRNAPTRECPASDSSPLSPNLLAAVTLLIAYTTLAHLQSFCPSSPWFWDPI